LGWGRYPKEGAVMFKHVLLIMLCVAFVLSCNKAKDGSGNSNELVINSMHGDETPKKIFNKILDMFKKENPGIEVKLNIVDHESFKTQIRTWLPNNPPDICTWFAGNRARYFIKKNLVEPIDDVWAESAGSFSEGSRKASSYNGKMYLMPANYYHWGFYYRKDLFKKAGIKTAPKSWEDLVKAVKALRKNKTIPITIGTKYKWPAAGWFDFINMRVNGFDFHMDLLHGEKSYTDPKVKKAMNVWGELVNLKAFPKNAAAMSWQEASALLWQGKAAMYLMGNFISTEIPKNNKGKIGFFGFPIYDKSIPLAQVAPIDVYFIPAKAKNKENAKKFLKFFAKKEIQELNANLSNQLPPNKDAKVNRDNKFLAAGEKLLSDASAVSQFFDRDADPEIASAGMNGFVEFMSYPKRLDKILEAIDKVRVRVNKVNERQN
jgi:multiple sugar transport system substrate-binding protein